MCVFVLQRSQRVFKVDWRLKLPPTPAPAAGQNNSWHEPCSLPHAHCFHYIHCMYVCVLWDVSLLTLNVFLCHVFAFCRLHRHKTRWTFVILMPINQHILIMASALSNNLWEKRTNTRQSVKKAQALSILINQNHWWPVRGCFFMSAPKVLCGVIKLSFQLINTRSSWFNVRLVRQQKHVFSFGMKYDL